MRLRVMTFTPCMLLGPLALTGCGTTTPAGALEIPMPAWVGQPCPRVVAPPEDQLPPMAEEQGAFDAQKRERDFWMQFTSQTNGDMRVLCRQRDEAVSVGARANQLVRDRN